MTAASEAGRPWGRPVAGRLVVNYRNGRATTHRAFVWSGRPNQFETFCGLVNPGARKHARALFVRSENVPTSCRSCLNASE